MPEMLARRSVHEQIIDQCMFGLRDRVSGKPHKKPTAIQLNHPGILDWDNPRCTHDPEEHEQISGSVRVVRERKWKTMRRSELAAEWPRPLCMWMLAGAKQILDLDAEDAMEVNLSEECPGMWLAVPVELEASPEGQLRQQMAQLESTQGLHRFDYISPSRASPRASARSSSSLWHICTWHWDTLVRTSWQGCCL